VTCVVFTDFVLEIRLFKYSTSLRVLCSQLLLRAVVDYIANLTVTEADFEVVKRDLGTMYINHSLKPHKLNQSVLLITISVTRVMLC